jgi:carbamoyltransferase
MAEEERFNREKHTYKFPVGAIAYCLATAGIEIKDVDLVTYGFLPTKFLRSQLVSAMRNLPMSLNLLKSGSSYMPLTRKLIGMYRIQDLCRTHLGAAPKNIQYVSHHLAHAYSTYSTSEFAESAILVVDGFGENESTSFFRGIDSSIEPISSVKLPHSLGVLYGAVTQYLGFLPHGDEYKVMGMAAYGTPKYFGAFGELVKYTGELQFQLNLDYFDFFKHGVAKWYSDKLIKLLGPRREQGAPYEQRHFDIACSLQFKLEDIIVKIGTDLYQRTGSKNLCVAGGVAQNVLMNHRLLNDCGFENIFVPPVSYDGGISLGSALAAYHLDTTQPRKLFMTKAYWGPEFLTETCKQALLDRNIVCDEPEYFFPELARLIFNKKIVGFFNGRMEIGPRALGNRSILATPCAPDMKDILNSRIKNREFFRPFAPVVTEEDCHRFFEIRHKSPFMTLVSKVKTPELLPAITHNDGTARVQTVAKDANPDLYHLLKEFEKISGVPVLINTSFNENEPIVNRPEEAVDCYLRTDMDVLAFNCKLIATKT